MLSRGFEDLETGQPEAKIKVPGARKLRTEIYTDAEADLMLALGGEPASSRRWRIGYVV